MIDLIVTNRSWGLSTFRIKEGTLRASVAGEVPKLPGREEHQVTLTFREGWTVVHGMFLGALFLLAFSGGLAGLWSYRSELVTAGGLAERIQRLRLGTVAMAALAWLTVVTGTFVVYPWYRDPAPDSPRSIIRANPATEQWHSFGMEVKEHIAWLSPLLATAVVFIVLYYGAQLARHDRLRNVTIWAFVGAFAAAAIAGLFGALITKVASVG